MNESNVPAQAGAVFTWPVRVYWEDTDAGGVVYYANYLKFLERARSEWLRSAGIEQEALIASEGLMFVVVHVDAHYRRPARYGELLEVTAQIAAATRTSITFGQQVLRRVGGAVEVLLDGRVRVACLDAAKFRPRPLPQSVLQEIGQ